ncbi:hypothetical protein L1887_14533 [Cichorium endivia]|nr:hypothetical protein L1887_14533 [Cichorium endivia]
MNHNTPENVTCLFSRATEQNAMLWHRRLGHANAKNLNRLAKNNIVWALPIKDFFTFEKCVACDQGKHHRKPHKPKLVNTIDLLLQLLHMDLFGPNKSETTELVTRFIKLIENQTNQKLKAIPCDNGTEFKNAVLDKFCGDKGVQRQYSAARTPQQNGVAERQNRTLIDAARTMLVDSKLPVFFWAEAINTVCYVQNQVIINKPQMKTPYEILYGRKPTVAHFCTFGCPYTLLHLEATPKFNSKANDCYFVGYAGKTAYRVYNKVTKQIMESFDVRWLEENETDTRVGPDWIFNYAEVFKSFNVLSNDVSGTQLGPSGVNRDGDAEIIHDPIIPSIIFEDPILNDGASPASTTVTEDAPVESSQAVGKPPVVDQSATHEDVINSDLADLFDSTLMESLFQERIPDEYVASTSHDFRDSDRGASGSGSIENITNMLISTATLEHAIPSRIQRDYPIDNIIGSLDDGGKKSLDTRWVFRNKQDDSGVIVRNKARLVVYGFRQIEGLDYTEVYAPVARLEAIRIFLAYASYMNFTVYQMDVNTAFLYGEVKEEIYVDQPPGFVNSKFPNHVYKLDKALYGLHQAPRACEVLCKEFEHVMKKRFEMSSLGEMMMFLGLQVKQSSTGILVHQGKYVEDILEKFEFKDAKSDKTPMSERPLLSSDPDGQSIDQTYYRSMIGSLMYLTASKPDIVFAVCQCARHQAKPKFSHLTAVKRIFRYLKGRPKLVLWYLKNREFDLYAFSDNNYGGCDIDRNSTSVGCQFLGDRLISWQCKKQQTVSTSTAEVEYVAASACCSQVVWMHHQLLDYGMNFVDTPIFCDNDAAIQIVRSCEIKAESVNNSGESL